MGGVRTPIIGRPRPLPRDRRADLQAEYLFFHATAVHTASPTADTAPTRLSARAALSRLIRRSRSASPTHDWVSFSQTRQDE